MVCYDKGTLQLLQSHSYEIIQCGKLSCISICLIRVIKGESETKGIAYIREAVAKVLKKFRVIHHTTSIILSTTLFVERISYNVLV